MSEIKGELTGELGIEDIKITLTDKPKEKPDWSNLVFGKLFTDHMFVMDYDEGMGWHDPRIVPYAPITIEPSAMVFHYGQAVFEGLKAYKNEAGSVTLFRPEKNFERLNTSDERLCIPHIDVNFAVAALTKLIEIEKDWVPSLQDTSLYIRPFTIATEGCLGVRISLSYKFIIILSPVGPYYSSGLSPVKIYIEDEFVRAVKGGIGFTKAAANYAASLKGQYKAKQEGFSQVLWLDGIDRKYIEEVGTMNVFFKINGELITPALGGSILAGVTRDSVIQLAKSWGITVTERRISVEEVYEAHENGTLEEIFGSGTAAVITPVGALSWRGNQINVGNGETGEFSRRVYDELTSIQSGRAEDKFGWVRKVV